MASKGGPPGGGQGNGPPSIPGPPYAPQVQMLGHIPSESPDTVINVMFLFLFSVAGIGHAMVFLGNKFSGRKFIITAMPSAFCLLRMITAGLRIVWAYNRENVRIGMAATILVYAGVVLLFFTNLIFTQRIIRAQHPIFGWSKPFSIFMPPVLFLSTITMIFTLIAAALIGYFSLDKTAREASEYIRKIAGVWLAMVSFLPIPMCIASCIARAPAKVRLRKMADHFGSGSMRTKVLIVLFGATLLCLGASFRAGINFMDVSPLRQPKNPEKFARQPWYLSKACFYIFNFAIELTVVMFWLAVRIDKRFIIRDGAKRPYSYAAGNLPIEGKIASDKIRMSSLPYSQQHLNGSQSVIASTLHSKRESRRSVISQDYRPRSMNSFEGDRVTWGGMALQGHETNTSQDSKRNFSDLSGSDEDLIPEGMGKELGWDPKSGTWAVRPISTAIANSRTNSRAAGPLSPLSPTHAPSSPLLQTTHSRNVSGVSSAPRSPRPSTAYDTRATSRPGTARSVAREPAISFAVDALRGPAKSFDYSDSRPDSIRSASRPPDGPYTLNPDDRPESIRSAYRPPTAPYANNSRPGSSSSYIAPIFRTPQAPYANDSGSRPGSSGSAYRTPLS